MIEIISEAFSANLAYALIDMLILEVILTLIFKSRKEMHLNLGLNDTRNTRLYVIGFVIAGLIFFLISNTLQNPITTLLFALGWKVHVIALGLFGLITFWVSKIMLSRSFKHPMVKASLIVFILCLVIFVGSYYVR